MTLTCLNDKYPAHSFYEHNRQMQLLKFDRRIEFATPGREGNKITFQSGYIGSDFLPRDIVLSKLLVV